MTFDDRGKTLENKYARDEEFRFRVNARAARLFGLWAAEKLGIGDANAYAEDVVEADFEEPGIKDMLRKVKKDFEDRGLPPDEHEFERKFSALLEQAKKEMGAA